MGAGDGRVRQRLESDLRGKTQVKTGFPGILPLPEYLKNTRACLQICPGCRHGTLVSVVELSSVF